MSAPVQVVVIGLHEPTFSGEVLTEIGRLQEAGIVRLVDVLLVTPPPTAVTTGTPLEEAWLSASDLQFLDELRQQRTAQA